MYLLDEGNNKTATGRKNTLELIDNFKPLSLGEVVSVDDPNYLGRIKVRIKGPRSRGGDDGLLDSELPWCIPMLPKFFSIQPKIKEAVFIFVFGKEQQHADRMYIGPIVSQPQQLNYDPYYTSAIRGFTFASETPNVSVDTIPQIKGVFPSPQDVSIQGRYNTDITQKTNEIVIRAGKFELTTVDKTNPLGFSFNSKTQGYIQIKNDVVVIKKTDKQPEKKGSVTNIVGNKINLLTHENGTPRFNLTNQDNLISDDELANILENAHQLAFGDVQLVYLKLLKNAILGHVHNGGGNPPTDLTTTGKMPLNELKKNADALEQQMLSKNIRIN